MWAPPRKKPKVQNEPNEIQVWLCPHGSDFDSFIDLPPLCCAQEIDTPDYAAEDQLDQEMLLDQCLVDFTDIDI